MALKAIVKFFDKTDAFKKEAGKFVTRAVAKSALLMERNIKESATNSFTQRTGHLRRSIRARTKDLGFGKAEVKINPVDEGGEVNYGVYLEYGTSKMAPRAFIRKGVANSEDQIKKIFADEAKNVKVSLKK